MSEKLQIGKSKPFSLFAPAQVTPIGLIEFLDISPDALVIVNQVGMIVMANQQAESLFGHAHGELLGLQLEVLLPPRYRSAHYIHREHFFASPLTRPMGAGLHLFGLRKDGIEFPVDISLRPLMLEEAPHVIGAIRDVTKLKELEEQNKLIQKANRLKNEFLANMSHELRTPLNGIIGFSEMLFDEVCGSTNDEQRECLDNILSSSRHLLQLINDVLDLTKVEAGKMVFSPEPVEPGKLIIHVLDLLYPVANKKELHISTKIDNTLTTVIVDPIKLKQVLYNYLSNAIKFTPDGGKICIRLTQEPHDTFRLEVEDTGIGIRPEDLERLFVEFQQLDSSASKRYQGTGLGLALVKRLVEAQGGRVGVRSIFGEGSTFFVVLPQITEATPGQIDLRSYQLPEVQANAPNILIIEDERKDLERLISICSQAGYNVDVATSGRQALAMCRQKAFDVITLDLILPDIDGWDVLRAMRSDELNNNVPVIVITIVKEKGVEAAFPIHTILIKPVQVDVLLEALKSLKKS
jgi:PAS domain S-box-containing protein